MGVQSHREIGDREIDAVNGKALLTIPLSGTAEMGQVDAGGKVFVNIEDKDQIDVIDVSAKKVAASWPVGPGSSPTGSSLDRTSHRLFVGAGKFACDGRHERKSPGKRPDLWRD